MGRFRLTVTVSATFRS
uniref:Uncharacterized protein n=1 Tax=Oryza punctata TaxID=4537 RepID=A0A0E0K0M3_ORYPU